MLKEKLRLETHKEPSLINDEAIIGAAVGDVTIGIAASIALSFIIPFNSAITVGSAIGMTAGGLLGGTIGEARLKKEQEYGKEVKTPGLLNKELFSKSAAAYLAFSLLSLASFAAIGPSAITTTISLLSITIAPLTGAILGAISGKERMQKEYVEAQEQARVRQQEQQRGVAPEISQEPELSNEKTKEFTKMIDQQRAEQAAQGISV